MESTIAASTGCATGGASSPVPVAIASSTKPNSPACARSRPVRSAPPVSLPNARASSVMSSALTTITAASTASTQYHPATTSRGSSSMPMVTKNSPSSTSRNGLMSSST